MSKEPLYGVGATKERKAKSKMTSGIRELSKGGIPINVGDRDLEHCVLDVLRNLGYIEDNQYDAGYQLRGLYFSFTKTGRWIEEGGKAYEGDVETDADRAEKKYHRALQHLDNANLIRTICIEETYIPANFMLVMDIQEGLNQLYEFFTGKRI